MTITPGYEVGSADDPMWTDLFIGCAFLAMAELAREHQGWPPSEAVKARAYALYEAELKEKNAAKQPSEERATG